MAEKIKKGVDRLLLVLIMKTNLLIYFVKLNFFFSFETKSSLSTFVFILSTNSQIMETKFYVFWTQTSRKLKSIFVNLIIITCP